MRKVKNTKYILQFFIIIFFLSILLTSKILTNKILVAFFLAIYAFVIKLLLDKPNTVSMYKKEVLKYMTIFGVIYVVLYYVIGIYVGYYKSVYTLSIFTLFNYVIPLIVIILTSEYIREVFISDKTRLSKINTFIFAVLVDLVIYVNIYNLFDIQEFLQALGYVFFASIVSNMLYNYIAEKFGVAPNISYRLITTLYVYLIPIIPNVYIYFKSICRMVYPLLIYVVLKSAYEKEKTIVTKNNRFFQNMITIVVVIIISVISMLISCKFKYGMLVIGSGSMTGAIDKGDAIIFEKENDAKKINEKDIIVFRDNKRTIVHRVIKKEDINDEIRLYTKGDNNMQEDPEYVTQSNLQGIVRIRIPDIGMPTIWINEFFNGIKKGN